jgi:hypothetical protein
MKMRDSQVIDGTAAGDSIAFNDLCTRVPPEHDSRARSESSRQSPAKS